MTRRIIKPQPDWLPEVTHAKSVSDTCPLMFPIGGLGQQCGHAIKRQYLPGQLLWVREKYWVVELPGCGVGNKYIVFDEEWKNQEPNPSSRSVAMADSHMRWGAHPSIHLPKKFARIWLRVKSVRVERVQDISEEDARAEGCKDKLTCLNPGTGSYAVERTSVEEFQTLWNEIHDPGAWERNDWVWAITFERTEKPE